MAGRSVLTTIRLRDGGSVETVEGAVDETFLCPVCMEAFVEPTSGCPEGHACCRACYESVLQSRSQKCPTCRKPTSTENLVRQRPLEELLNKTMVRCKNAKAGDAAAPGNEGPASKRARISQPAGGVAAAEGEAAGGCAWTGPLGDVEAHLKSSCGFELVPCKFSAPSRFEDEDDVCDELVLRRVQEEHAAECQYRPVQCRHCQTTVCLHQMEGHERYCLEKVVECANQGCSAVMKQGEMDEHCDTCEFQSVACPCHGCRTRLLRRDLPAHLAPGTPHDGHVAALIRQNAELVAQQEKMELRMREQVGVAAFEWSIARGWGGDRGSKVRSQPVSCGPFKICLVFSKRQELGENGAEEFLFKCKLLDENVTLDADLEITVANASKYAMLAFPRTKRTVQGPGENRFRDFLRPNATKYSPSARQRADTTLDDGAILARAVVRLNLSYIDEHLGPGAHLPRIADA
ncbi:hypothetical protein T484DRAFT_1932350 [Baffinella frigidus]|nr:hypothetical protein T484DRAFT_1932350 [Cryptophyta sp. CCMP2293]